MSVVHHRGVSNRCRFLAVLCFISTLVNLSAQEVSFPRENLEQMDRYEVNQLQQADRAFQQEGWRQAEAAYESFILEFPQSQALAYAVLRKARSMHLDNKRFEALKVYQDVIDYFPNQPHYAAAALYHSGEAHMGNGHPEQAVRAWTGMAADPEYVKQPLAARALQQLADYLVNNEEAEKAMPFYQQIVDNFRTENRDAAREAIQSMLNHAIRRAPDEAMVRGIYVTGQGFGHEPIEVPENLDGNRDYWQAVIEQINHRGRFEADQKEDEQAYYQYWAAQLEKRLMDWDTARITWAEYLRRAGEDESDWLERLDTIYAREKDSLPERTLRWMSLLQEQPENLQEYYGKLDLKALSPEESYQVQFTLAGSKAADNFLTQALQGSQAPAFGDDQLFRLIEAYRRRGLTAAMEYAALQMDDPDRGKLEILRHHREAGNLELGLALADQLLKSSPTHAADALWLKGHLLEDAKRYEEAIAVYRQSGNLPGRFWRIAACYEAMGQIEAAVKTLREAESMVEDQQPEAAWLIAEIYSRSKQIERQAEALRHLLARYPDSSRSRDAHLSLERMGITVLGGGVDAK